MAAIFRPIRFYPVSADELIEARLAFPHGQYPLRIEETEFSADYQAALMRDRESIYTYKRTQQAAFDAERQLWKQGEIDVDQDSSASPLPTAEWQRDWARTETADGLTEVLMQRAAGSGIAYLWEQKLLKTPVPKD